MDRERAVHLDHDYGRDRQRAGTVSFDVENYTGTANRSATMTIAGQTVDVVQEGLTCTFDVTPTSRSLPAAAGTSNFSVSAAAGCTWTATEQISWLTIATGQENGNGTGTVNFSVTAHTGTSQRSGTLTIAGEQVTVTQAGSGTICNYSVTPTSRSVPRPAEARPSRWRRRQAARGRRPSRPPGSRSQVERTAAETARSTSAPPRTPVRLSGAER